MKVLVLGTPGQLGHELMKAAWPAETRLDGVGYPGFDLSRPGAVDEILAAPPSAPPSAHEPELVVNATAYTAVDKAESEPELAYLINRDGPARMAELTAARGVPLIHVSTDYVFDGTRPGLYREDEPVAPANVYGASKAAGEEAVRQGNPRHIILRTSWVYAVHGQNFVHTMLRLGREREELGVVADQWGAPTAAADLAAAIVTIAGRIAADPATVPWGTYHCTGRGETSWHGFAGHIFAALERAEGRRPRLKAIATADYPTPARRPLNSRLDGSRLAAAFGIVLPPWQESLDRVLAELLSSRNS